MVPELRYKCVVGRLSGPRVRRGCVVGRLSGPRVRRKCVVGRLRGPRVRRKYVVGRLSGPRKRQDFFGCITAVVFNLFSAAAHLKSDIQIRDTLSWQHHDLNNLEENGLPSSYLFLSLLFPLPGRVKCARCNNVRMGLPLCHVASGATWCFHFI